MSITFFGTYNTKTTPRLQTIIDGCRDRDVRVVECNVPLKLNTDNRVEILQKPWKLPILAINILLCWIKLFRKSRKLPSTDAVIIGYLGQFDIHLAKLLYRHKTLVLDYMVSGSDTAKDRRSSGSIKQVFLKALGNSSLRLADLILLDTEDRIDTLPAKYRHKAVVAYVGASTKWFDAAKKPTYDKDRKKPISIIFFGAYTPLHGTKTIAKAIARLKVPVNVTMLGGGQDLKETKRIMSTKASTTQVEWLSLEDVTDLPNKVAGFDICLGLFGDSEKADKVVPNKVYQGASVGCAIITRDNPPQRRILGDNAVFVTPADYLALTDAITDLVKSPNTLYRYKLAAYNLAQTSFKPADIVVPLLNSVKNKTS